MIRVTVEIWPCGDRRRAWTQAVAVIDCEPGQGNVRNYTVHVGESRNEVAQTMDWSSDGRILQHDRRASIWALIAKVSVWGAQEAEKR